MKQQLMRYLAVVSSVDGQTMHQFTTNHRNEVQQFFEKYDHEGSSISLTIFLDDASEIYGVLGGDSV